MLAPDGLFGPRLRFRDPCRIEDDPQAVITRHLQRFEADRAREQALRDAMLSHLYDVTVDVEGQGMTRKRSRALIASRSETEPNAEHRRVLDVATTRLIGANRTSQTRDDALPVLLDDSRWSPKPGRRTTTPVSTRSLHFGSVPHSRRQRWVQSQLRT